jgi:hypothetical protein
VQSSIDRLSSLRADLLLLTYRDANVVDVLQPPSIVHGSGPSARLLGVVLGALCGGLAAIGAVTFWRAGTAGLISPANAGAVVGRVLHPQVRLARRWSSAAFLADPSRDRYVPRLLATQLAGRRSLAGHVIAVTGVSPRSASAAVATMIAVGAAEQTPALLARFGGYSACAESVRGNGQGLERIPSGVDNLTVVELDNLSRPIDVARGGLAQLVDAAKSEGRCLVVHVGCLRSSPDMLHLLPSTADLVLALGAGVDTLAEAAAAVAASCTAAGRLVAVVTRVPWSLRPSRRGKLRDGQSGG